MPNPFVQLRYRLPFTFLALVVTLVMALTTFAIAEEPLSEETVAERAKSAWENGDLDGAIDILDQWTQIHPPSLALDKLVGNILATSRRLQDAVEAYDRALVRKPTALDIRWAKWSVLVRSGRREEAIAELERIAQADAQNPLIHLRLAQELRKLDRLNESLELYKKAVELVPDLLSWRLGMARARFDVLDYPTAYAEVQSVLEKAPRGSPLETPAQELLSIILGVGTERGRRFDPFPPQQVTPERRTEWALLRGDAWRLFAAGKYAEAEPAYRRLLALNPEDPTAAHQLGLILMELGRCKEALPFFLAMSSIKPSDEEHLDSFFRMGRCLVELEQWSEALGYFQILYDEAVELENSTKDHPLPPGTRVLDKKKLAQWIEKVRPHVPDADSIESREPSSSTGLSAEELFATLAAKPLKPKKPLDPRASLMGRDADFSSFRFVIPASKVMRDDSPTGDHEFVPLNAGDSFPTTQKEIYLVFALLSASYDEVTLTAQCFLEASELTGEQRAVAQDKVVMSNDQSGYFKLSPPKKGWPPGLYRCGLFEGEQTSAYSHVDEVRFRIVKPTRSIP
jgi:tetratricopeptide (TPR) repeat protein